jgi:hypothetical protein
MPNQQAVIQTKTLISILTNAFKVSPLVNRLIVSRENVENVVNEPKNPMSKNARNSGPVDNRSISKTANMPIINEPIKLTNKVP